MHPTSPYCLAKAANIRDLAILVQELGSSYLGTSKLKRLSSESDGILSQVINLTAICKKTSFMESDR